MTSAERLLELTRISDTIPIDQFPVKRVNTIWLVRIITFDDASSLAFMSDRVLVLNNPTETVAYLQQMWQTQPEARTWIKENEPELNEMFHESLVY